MGEKLKSVCLGIFCPIWLPLFILFYPIHWLVRCCVRRCCIRCCTKHCCKCCSCYWEDVEPETQISGEQIVINTIDPATGEPVRLIKETVKVIGIDPSTGKPVAVLKETVSMIGRDGLVVEENVAVVTPDNIRVQGQVVVGQAQNGTSIVGERPVPAIRY